MYVKHRFKITEVQNGTWKDIIGVMLVSLIFVYLYHFEGMKFLAIPLPIAGILGTTISLILAFRTNASYDRWWEARKVWGAIVNDSRSLVRQVVANAGAKVASKDLQKMAYRQIAWNYALSRHLRGQEILPAIQKYLTEEELNILKKHQNIPNALLQLHERQLKSLHEKAILDSYIYTHLSDTLQQLTDHMGKCERIKNTFFPTQYSFYIHFTILVFVTTLPLGIMEALDFFAVLVTGIVAFLFIAIERMAISMQCPFDNMPNDTPMTALSATIEINILDLLGEEHDLKPLQPQKGILM